jgi:hypothetical protein
VPEDPVTDTSRVLDVTKILDRAIADAVSAAAGKKVASAKPTIGTLILFDAGDTAIANAASAIKSGYYMSGTLQGVSTWKELTAALAKYSTIQTLVMFFHSAGGQLIFESENPTAASVRERLAASATKVTGTIRFEGCNIMLEPVTTAYLVSGIAGPSAVVSGYTYYSLFNHLTISGFSRDQAQALLNSYADFWIPATPTADAIAASKTPLKLWQRWFRDEYNEDPLPQRPAGTDPPKGFVPLSRLEQRTVKSGDDAVKLEGELQAAPVHPAALVTVHNIAAVAAKYQRP